MERLDRLKSSWHVNKNFYELGKEVENEHYSLCPKDYQGSPGRVSYSTFLTFSQILLLIKSVWNLVGARSFYLFSFAIFIANCYRLLLYAVEKVVGFFGASVSATWKLDGGVVISSWVLWILVIAAFEAFVKVKVTATEFNQFLYVGFVISLLDLKNVLIAGLVLVGTLTGLYLLMQMHLLKTEINCVGCRICHQLCSKQNSEETWWDEKVFLCACCDEVRMKVNNPQFQKQLCVGGGGKSPPTPPPQDVLLLATTRSEANSRVNSIISEYESFSIRKKDSSRSVVRSEIINRGEIMKREGVKMKRLPKDTVRVSYENEELYTKIRDFFNEAGVKMVPTGGDYDYQVLVVVLTPQYEFNKTCKQQYTLDKYFTKRRIVFLAGSEEVLHMHQSIIIDHDKMVKYQVFDDSSFKAVMGAMVEEELC